MRDTAAPVPQYQEYASLFTRCDFLSVTHYFTLRKAFTEIVIWILKNL